MFDNIKKKIIKWLCHNAGTYKNNKYGVPYFSLIINILIWTIIIVLGVHLIVNIYYIVTRPEYLYIAVLDIILDTEFWNFVIVMVSVIIFVHILIIKLKICKFLSKFAFVCDRFQLSPEVKELYDHIMILDIHKKREFLKLTNSIHNQLIRDIENSKEVR